MGPRRFADLVPHGGFTLGNVRTEANAGATVRLGLPLPDDFGPWRDAPAIPAHGGAALSVFARAEGRAVARDLFLDGNTFAPSLRVHKLPFVGEAQLGLGLHWRAVGFRYTFSYTTREFRERPYRPEYGSFTFIL